MDTVVKRTVSSLIVTFSFSTATTVAAHHSPPRPSVGSYAHLPSISTAAPGR